MKREGWRNTKGEKIIPPTVQIPTGPRAQLSSQRLEENKAFDSRFRGELVYEGSCIEWS